MIMPNIWKNKNVPNHQPGWKSSTTFGGAPNPKRQEKVG
jgi:hypothetical protein